MKYIISLGCMILINVAGAWAQEPDEIAQEPTAKVYSGSVQSVFRDQGPSIWLTGSREWDSGTSSRMDIYYESLNLESRIPDSSAPSDTYLCVTNEKRVSLEAFPWIWKSGSHEGPLGFGIGLGLWESFWSPQGAYNANITYVHITGFSSASLLGPRLLFTGRIGPEDDLNFQWDFSVQPGNLQLFIQSSGLLPVIPEKSIQSLGFGSVVQRLQADIFLGKTLALTLDQSFEWLGLKQLTVNDTGNGWVEAQRDETRLVIFPRIGIFGEFEDLKVLVNAGYEMRFQIQGQRGRGFYDGRLGAGLSLRL